MARVLAYEVDGELLPVSVEVRMKNGPCAHDEEPPDQSTGIEWERQGCNCWPGDDDASERQETYWPNPDAVPAGGLPVRLLKNLRVTDFVTSYRQGVQTLAEHGALNSPNKAVAEHLRAIADAAKRPAVGRGRPKADPYVHLTRLAALDAAYASGKTQANAARSLGISAPTLQATLAWARQQDPPLWAALGRGRAGRLTPHGRAVVARAQKQRGRQA